MAYQAPPAVCSLPAYQAFMPLSGFPPALGYCSTTSLPNKRTVHQRPHDVQCPAGNNHLCDLLSELKVSDHEFARSVCCCIGVCLGTQPTALVTVPETKPTTVSSIQPPRVSLSSTSNVDSNTVTSSTSNVLATSAVSPSFTSPASSIPTVPSVTSPSSTSSNSLSLNSTSSSVFSTSNSVSPSSSSSSLSSSSSSSTATCPTTITADPSCTTIAATGALSVTYTEYYSGQYYIEQYNNEGNDQSASNPPIYSSFPGTLDMCDAANNCANIGDAADATQDTVYYSFDLHYLASNSSWECVLYYDNNTDSTQFSVADPDACLSFGFSSPENF